MYSWSQQPMAFEAIYQETFAFVRRSLRRLGVAAGDLDDAIQDVYLVVHRRLASFEGRSTLTTWIYGIARKVAPRYRARVGDEASPPPAEVGETDPYEEVARVEGVDLLGRLLAELPDEKREVFVLAELESMPAPEIARRLSIDLTTVHWRLRASRAAFERALERHNAREAWRAFGRTSGQGESAAERSRRQRCWLALGVTTGRPPAIAAGSAGAASALSAAVWAPVSAGIVAATGLVGVLIAGPTSPRVGDGAPRGADVAGLVPGERPAMSTAPVVAPLRREPAAVSGAAAAAPLRREPAAVSGAAAAAPLRREPAAVSGAAAAARLPPEPAAVSGAAAARVAPLPPAPAAVRTAAASVAPPAGQRAPIDPPRSASTVEVAALAAPAAATPLAALAAPAAVAPRAAPAAPAAATPLAALAAPAAVAPRAALAAPAAATPLAALAAPAAVAPFAAPAAPVAAPFAAPAAPAAVAPSRAAPAAPAVAPFAAPAAPAAVAPSRAAPAAPGLHGAPAGAAASAATIDPAWRAGVTPVARRDTAFERAVEPSPVVAPRPSLPARSPIAPPHRAPARAPSDATRGVGSATVWTISSAAGARSSATRPLGLAAEASLLLDADRALERGDFAAAGRALAAHRRWFRRGQLSREREGLALALVRASGRPDSRTQGD